MIEITGLAHCDLIAGTDQFANHVAVRNGVLPEVGVVVAMDRIGREQVDAIDLPVGSHDVLGEPLRSRGLESIHCVLGRELVASEQMGHAEGREL